MGQNLKIIEIQIFAFFDEAQVTNLPCKLHGRKWFNKGKNDALVN